MKIEINEAQAALLRDLLTARLGNLSTEIRHTDNAQFRQGLREERDLLKSLLQSLEPVAA